jgi:hypothetical protein
VRRSGTVIGVALGERECSVAEVAESKSGAVSVVRVGTFAYPAGVTVDQSQALGEALGKFMKGAGFGGGKAVVGLPARWLTSRERQVPPSDQATASAMLRLQAERQFPPELKDLVFDYAGRADASEGRTVLLLAASRQQVTRAAEAVRLAGMTPVAVTPSGLALSAVTKARTVLALTGDSAELVVRSEHGPRVLRHVGVTGAQLLGSNGVPAPGLAALGSELLRTVSVTGEGNSEAVSLFDGVGLEENAISLLSRRAGMTLSSARNLAQLDVGGEGAMGAGSARYGAAVALALVGLRPELMPADFLHTRLAPPKQRRVGRRVVWGAIAGVVLLGLIGYPVYDIYSTQAEIDGIYDSLAAKADEVKAAEQMAARMKLARGWYDLKPPVLDCLKHVTQAFPQEGTVWATNFTMKETGRGTLTGKGTDRRAVYAVRDFLMNDKRFSDVQLTETHEAAGAGGAPAAPAGGTSTSSSSRDRERDTSFVITFTFKEAAKP